MNTDFEGDALKEATLKIPYTSKAKAAKLNNNPIQAANLFIALKRFVYETLFGMPYDSSSKKTMPRLSQNTVNSKFFKTHYQSMFGRFATCETPPMGQGLAFADVAEEQDRHKEHCHAIVYTNLRPEVVQIVSSINFLEDIVVELMDSMTSHELPAVHQLKHTIFQEALKQNAERYARQTFEFDSNVYDDDCVKRLAHLVVMSVNMHAHSKTCFKGNVRNFQNISLIRQNTHHKSFNAKYYHPSNHISCLQIVLECPLRGLSFEDQVRSIST